MWILNLNDMIELQMTGVNHRLTCNLELNQNNIRKGYGFLPGIYQNMKTKLNKNAEQELIWNYIIQV